VPWITAEWNVIVWVRPEGNESRILNPEFSPPNKPFIFNETATFAARRSMSDIPIGATNRPV
jgi:hypothetical protein